VPNPAPNHRCSSASTIAPNHHLRWGCLRLRAVNSKQKAGALAPAAQFAPSTFSRCDDPHDHGCPIFAGQPERLTAKVGKHERKLTAVIQSISSQRSDTADNAHHELQRMAASLLHLIQFSLASPLNHSKFGSPPVSPASAPAPGSRQPQTEPAAHGLLRPDSDAADQRPQGSSAYRTQLQSDRCSSMCDRPLRICPARSRSSRACHSPQSSSSARPTRECADRRETQQRILVLRLFA
jgi:hypothetical protein